MPQLRRLGLNPGTTGKKVLVRTNAFTVNWNRPSSSTGFIFHYDDIIPLWKTPGEVSIGHKKGTELLMRLQDRVRPDLFKAKGAFDGKKNMFSFAEYNFRSQEFKVPWEVNESMDQRKTVAIRIVFVKRIDVSVLHRLIQGDPASIKPESDSSTAINMLNLFVQSAPRLAQPDMFNPKSFFTPTNKYTNQSIQPLELWRGHFQHVYFSFLAMLPRLIYFTDDRSVRPTDGQIIVNVDVTIGVVLPGNLNLEKLCAEYLGIETRRLDSFIPKLRLFLKGVKVVIDLPGHTNKRPKVIKDIIAKVDEFTFDKGGERITVASHFALAHRYTVRRGSLGVKLGSAGVFPMNVCRTVQQLYKSRASPEVVREALEFSPRDPNQRLQAIKAGWQELQYTTSYFLRGAGITINPEPISVHGRLLTSPLILFGNERLSLQRPGTWDVMRKRLNQPARLQRWVIVNFANADRSLLQKFIDDLMKCMGERGMSVTNPGDCIAASPHSNIASALYDAGKKYRAEMMLVILPESALGIYREVKSFGDILQGVATQCVKWSRKLSNDARDGRANQYMNNLILKINAKLGGINFVPSSDAMKFLGNGEPTMVIGADVSHPAPGSLLPSVSALVSSRDETFSKYVASIRVQEHRTEIIQDFAEMFTIATYAFISRNKKPPKRIFIFRDGVSEGEFTNVLDQEVQAMQSTFTELYKESPWPKITFIVVGKRHHFRFFGEPKSESVDPKGNGNLYSGFVTDRDVIHPYYLDFYLQSQPGLKGTSRPSHYTVLRNDLGLTSDQLQEIAYSLCHCYSRATRAVKIPAPVYYADLVCRRAKFHFDDEVGDIDAMSVASGERHLDFYKDHFRKINQQIKASMYFV